MSLQQKMVRKIDDYGGIELLTSEMERLRRFTNEKKWFDNMIIYFNSLYSQIVDVEGQAVEYHKATVDTVEFLEEFNVVRKEPTINFLIDLINFKLKSVSGVRKIKIG